ncbi:MAG: hypothetical protein O3B08_15990, partial [Proteobacteria bacterium]|nr:hypothetical protein [Pseudomonadota bacterium]
MAITAPSVLAAPVFHPAGLNPGDTYRLAFLTSASTDALSSDINFYNQFVTDVANGPFTDSTAQIAHNLAWKAIISTETIDARDNTGTNPNNGAGVPIFLLDGRKLADNYADFWDGSLDTTFDYLGDGSGGLPFGEPVWTGTLADGTANPFGFVGIFDSMLSITYGINDSTTGTWVESLDFLSPTIDARLYAVSGIIWVDEPAPLSLLALGIVALA